SGSNDDCGAGNPRRCRIGQRSQRERTGRSCARAQRRSVTSTVIQTTTVISVSTAGTSITSRPSLTDMAENQAPGPSVRSATVSSRRSGDRLPRYRTGDADLDQRIVELLDAVDVRHDRDQLFEILTSAVRLAGDDADRLDLKITNSA